MLALGITWHQIPGMWYHMVLVLRGASVVSSGAMVSSDTDTTWY